MADNYCIASSFLEFPEAKKSQVEAIISRIAKEIEEGYEAGEEEYSYLGVDIDVEHNGVWFHTDESLIPEHVERIARAIIEELEIDSPFYCSWAFTCSKPRIDEFGGGAFAIVRGRDTHWVDAMTECVRWAEGTIVGEEDDPTGREK